VTCDNLYILTSGGDLKEYSGLAVYYHRGWTYVTFSTAEHRWTVRADAPIAGQYHDYSISWGQDLGLEVRLSSSVSLCFSLSLCSSVSLFSSVSLRDCLDTK
jgi:hypothetical protein